MTKVTIISGFLGAGKTTLIKKLLAEVYTDMKVVLIENEFGEIGIDGGFLKDAGVQINEMNSGCICCSLVGDFAEALKKVTADYTPDLILIEPSGVGKLSDVAKAVENVKDEVGLELDSFITVADGTKCKMYMKNFGEFYNDQIENASTIVLSRTQNMDEHKLEESVAIIKEHNDKAPVITTPWDQLDGDVIKKALESKDLLAELMEDLEHEHHHEHDGECSCGHHHEHEHEHEHHHEHDGECCCGHHHHHHADEVFNSWGVETPHKYDKAEIEAILKRLVETDEFGVILRAKGMVPDKNGSWIYFDAVPGEYEVREGSPEYTGKLCVIGTGVEEGKMKELFGLI